MDNAILTICCLTYNHEKYIRKTLEGFINQKTTYNYKIIIHDDASKDKTKYIIEEFAEKYPKLIIPIFQQKNQYSQGISIYKTFIEPLIDTKYIAICEGDDYWNANDKIQLQINYLEKHPECSLCVHNTVKINEAGDSLNEYMTKLDVGDRDISTNEIIESCGKSPFHTSSYIYRTELKRMMPSVFYMLPVGDYPLAIYMSLVGKIHYINKVMSAYRVMSQGSWSEKNKSNKKFAYDTSCKMIVGLKCLNSYTKYKYNKEFSKVIRWHEFDNIIYERHYLRILKEKKYWILLLKKLIPNKIKKYIKKVIYK